MEIVLKCIRIDIYYKKKIGIEFFQILPQIGLYERRIFRI